MKAVKYKKRAAKRTRLSVSAFASAQAKPKAPAREYRLEDRIRFIAARRHQRRVSLDGRDCGGCYEGRCDGISPARDETEPQPCAFEVCQ